MRSGDGGPVPELEAFRAEVREYIARTAPRIPRRAGIRAAHDTAELAQLRAFAQGMQARGYLGTPSERAPRDPARDVVVEEELARAEAPEFLGANMLAAHALILFGTAEQQERLLPAAESYDDLWCQLFSEPGAGSDLAGLATRAVRVEDGFRVTGQKVWSTGAQWADRGYLLARTNPDRPKHGGITAFALDMREAGITVRPLREMTGTSDFNEVFLDGVFVADRDVLGPLDEGWRVCQASLAQERAGVGRVAITLERNLAALHRLCADFPIDDPATAAARRDRFGALAVRVLAARALVDDGAARAAAGTDRPTDPALAKLVFSELNEAMAGFGLGAQGGAGLLAVDDPDAYDGGRWQDELLYAKAWTIAGGSNELMRNLLAERGLGLPRG